MNPVPPVLVPSSSPGPPLAEPDSLEQLIGDCRQMARHWKAPAAQPQAAGAPAGPHGIKVSAASVQAVDGMAEYGG